MHIVVKVRNSIFTELFLPVLKKNLARTLHEKEAIELHTVKKGTRMLQEWVAGVLNEKVVRALYVRS